MLVTMIWLNAWHAIASLLGSRGRFWTLSALEVGVAAFKGLATFVNFYLYWHHCLHVLGQAEYELASNISQILRELLEVSLRPEEAMASLAPVSVGAMGLAFQAGSGRMPDPAGLTKALAWMVLPRLTASLSNLLYEGLASQAHYASNVWVALGTLIPSLAAYYLAASARQERSTLASECVSLLSPSNVALAALKSQARTISCAMIRGKGALYEQTVDKGANLAYLLLADRQKALSHVPELAGLLVKCLIIFRMRQGQEAWGPSGSLLYYLLVPGAFFVLVGAVQPSGRGNLLTALWRMARLWFLFT